MKARHRDPNHLSNGLYRLLERGAAYELFQKLLGARDARQRFVAEFLRPPARARVLDIGCGTGSLLEDLPIDVDYVGYDLNPRYIAAAEQRWGGRGRFFCARVGDEPLESTASGFDYVVAKGILHHLSDAEAEILVGSARRHLRLGGVLVTWDCVFHPGQSWIARLLISCDRGRRVRTPDGYRSLVAKSFTDIEEHLATDLAAVPYSHFILMARKT